MARSLLYLVSNDIGHIVTLYAMLHKVKNIYFGGFFLRYTTEFLSLKAHQICIFEVQFLQCILQAPPGELAHNFICSQLLEQGWGQSQFPETRGLFGSYWCLPQGLSVGSDPWAQRWQLLVDWKPLWIKLIIPIFWAGIEHFGKTKFLPKPPIVMGQISIFLGLVEWLKVNLIT